MLSMNKKYKRSKTALMKAVFPEMSHVTFVFSSNITHELNCYNVCSIENKKPLDLEKKITLELVYKYFLTPLSECELTLV